MANPSTKSALCGALSRFLDSADLSDFTIVCDQTQWRAHRLVLCLHSDVLAKWTAGDFQEAKEGKVDLSGQYEPHHVDALVTYLYTLDYNIDALEHHADRMNFHISMCIVADKYNIPGLTSLALQKFESIAAQTKTATELAEASLLAYDAPSATVKIRQSIVSLITQKRDYYLPFSTTEDSAALEEAIRKYPELALDIAKGQPPAPLKPAQCEEKAYQCVNAGCGYQFRAYLANTRNTSYNCPKCGYHANGEGWNKHCLRK